jgi:hypothetical protein
MTNLEAARRYGGFDETKEKITYLLLLITKKWIEKIHK